MRISDPTRRRDKGAHAQMSCQGKRANARGVRARGKRIQGTHKGKGTTHVSHEYPAQWIPTDEGTHTRTLGGANIKLDMRADAMLTTQDRRDRVGATYAALVVSLELRKGRVLI